MVMVGGGGGGLLLLIHECDCDCDGAQDGSVLDLWHCMWMGCCCRVVVLVLGIVDEKTTAPLLRQSVFRVLCELRMQCAIIGGDRLLVLYRTLRLRQGSPLAHSVLFGSV
jgi:hypothetical protein